MSRGITFRAAVLSVSILWAASPVVAFGAEPYASAGGLSTAQSDAIDRYVRAEMVRQRIPGLELGIYRAGKAVLERGYGSANLEWPAPVEPDTLFQSGSVGKQFTAAAVMMLVQEGKIGLSDSIIKYFPDAPASWGPIKVENLLSHTSGLSEYGTDERAGPGGEFDLRLEFSEDQLVAKMEKMPIEWAPGENWAYRNTNYVLLGVLIHKVTGKFYADFLHERIFTPLGMTSTRSISDADIIRHRAAGYEIRAGQLKNQSYVSPTFNSTADGALYFNVVDLERWDHALMGEQLLKTAALERMWTPFKLNDGKPNSAGYGFAWFTGEIKGHRLVSHDGAWQGFTTNISRYVDDKLTIVVLTNLDAGHSRPANVARVVAGLVEPALMPEPASLISDDRPEIARRLLALLKDLRRGADVSAEITSGGKVRFTPDMVADVLSALPPDWTEAPMVLATRRADGDQTVSVFRIGKPGDLRRVTVVTDASGRFASLDAGPDPDNR